MQMRSQHEIRGRKQIERHAGRRLTCRERERATQRPVPRDRVRDRLMVARLAELLQVQQVALEWKSPHLPEWAVQPREGLGLNGLRVVG